jgi:hypothetical protein
MRLRAIGMAAGLLGAAFGTAAAHHSMAMFDQQHQVDLQGVVQDFRFVSPHSFIVLQVKESGGAATLWSLEGDSPSHLARDGWTSHSLKAGDQVKLKVAPLRSGAPGGHFWAEKVFFLDGKPIADLPSE